MYGHHWYSEDHDGTDFYPVPFINYTMNTDLFFHKSHVYFSYSIVNSDHDCRDNTLWYHKQTKLLFLKALLLDDYQDIWYDHDMLLLNGTFDEF